MARHSKPAKDKAPERKRVTGASSRLAKANAQEQAVAKTNTTKPKRLTPHEEQFVLEYLVDLNGTQAAIRAGYSEKAARQTAYRMLTKDYIQEAIAGARKAQQERTQITADRVLREAWNQVTADARELTQLHVGCCRYCHGIEHRYQRTNAQFEADYAEWERDPAPISDKGHFNEAGGPGFNPQAKPHPDCPECAGNGEPRVVLMDTRDMSDGARSLFAGVKQTKFGIEIQMHSKDAAMEKLFKHLGLYEKDNEQKLDPLSTLLAGFTNGTGNGFKPVSDDPEHAHTQNLSTLGPVDDSDFTQDED